MRGVGRTVGPSSDARLRPGQLRPRHHTIAVALAGFAAIVALAGCTAAEASPAARSSAAATATASPQPPATIAAASPSPTASSTANPLANLGPAPTTPWTSVDWIAIPAGKSPAVQVAPASMDSLAVNLFGWSRGFVDFIWNPTTRTIVPWSSADGLTWIAGPSLDMASFAAGLEEWDAGDFASEGCDLQIRSVSESPAGLAAHGWLTCAGGCGYAYLGPAVWTSTDGISWRRVDVANAFGGGVPESISGGSNGFIALGTAGQHQAVWTSTDGQSWRLSVGPTAPSADSSVELSSPASFGGGFVLGGGLHWGRACAYIMEPDLMTPAIWWSADGTTWTLDNLSGGITGIGVTVRISRISDHALLAEEMSWRADDPSQSDSVAWTSVDGRTWTLRQDGASPAGMTFFTNGNRSLGYDDQHRLYSFDDNLNPTVLAQSGTSPGSTWIAALGPTGLLVTVDGTRFWIGVPQSS